MSDEQVIEKEAFEVPPEPETKAVAMPTRADLKEKGWTANEMDAAEKRGMVESPEAKAKKEADDKTKAAVDAKTKADADAKAKADADAKAIADGTKKPEFKPSSLPDFTFKTPEQEKAFLDAFGAGTPQRAMYFRMKNERSARQQEKQAREASDKRVAELEAENKALKLGKPTIEQEVDDNGNVIDPEDKPLTLKQLRELQKAEAEAQDKKKQELNSKAEKLVEAQTTQEEYTRTIYPDFDPTVDLAKDLIKNLETLVPEKWKQTKIIKQIRDLQFAAANADQIDLDEYHAAMIAYEIGQMHPKYGKSADEKPADANGDASDKDGKPDPSKANGGPKLTPEQMKRIEENTQRRQSSASIKGGDGKRTVTAESMDIATLNKLNYADRQRFRSKFPDRYAQLVRG